MKNKRVFLGRNYHRLPPLDLLAVQKESWEKFLAQDLARGLANISPVVDQSGNWELSFDNVYISEPLRSEKEARRRNLSYTVAVETEASLLYKPTSQSWQKRVYLFDLPQMTARGTFIINGVERCLVSQVTRAPGVYFTQEVDKRTSRLLSQAEIRPLFGSWLEFLVAPNETIWMRIDRRRKLPVTLLLRGLGIESDEELIHEFSDFLIPTIEADNTKTRQEAIMEIYRRMRPGEPVILEKAQEFFNSLFFDPRRYSLDKTGRYKINKRLGLEIPNEPKNWTLKREDLVATLKYLITLQKGEGGKTDDIDHLANRYVRCVGTLLAQVPYRLGLLRFERMLRQRLALLDPKTVNLSFLVNSQPLIASINEFFRVNRLSTILDQTNPLSELDNLRRLSVMGPGGLTRERAPFSIRDISSSQYGRICPVRSPEGQNIGLVTYLACYARVNEYGFLETPYKRVAPVKKDGKTRMKIEEEIIYLPPDDEEKYYITSGDIARDEEGFLIPSLVPARFGGEFLEVPVEKVQLIDICPQQVVGASASLIPFLDHDEPARALMGSHMECQAVPLVKTEAPVVGTGMEAVVPEQMGWVVRARHSGRVIFADSSKVVVKINPKEVNAEEEEKGISTVKIEGDKEIYYLEKFKRTSPYGTCYSQKPQVTVGEEIKKGEVLIDGPACDNGELALGKNLLIAYCSYEGLGFEDAIVISDRLVKEDTFTSITIHEFSCEVAETKLGPEELTRDIPNVAEAELANLGEDGLVTVGSFVQANDILVGKIAPKGETELTAEERLLRAIFGEKAREVRDTSLRLPHGVEGTVVRVEVLDRQEDEEGFSPGVIKVITVWVAQTRKIREGDKLAGRHGNKGVISKIVPVADMPYLADGTPVDIIISPLSVLARMNLGQLLEAHLGLVAQKLGYKVAIPVFEKFDEQFLQGEFEKAGLDKDYKTVLYDGRTGEPLEERAVVGVAYILKLLHMVEDKVHARSIGPYSLVTQQPLGGKAQMGGQRFGEMEVWGLEAHRAAHMLQEMLTIKSDDVVGRAKAFEAIVKGMDIPESKVPESFKVLLSELKSLGLAVIPKEEEKEEKGTEEEKPAEEEKPLEAKDNEANQLVGAEKDNINSIMDTAR